MILKSINPSIYRVSRNLPLRVILIVPFILQTFGAVGLVGYLSFRNGQTAVNDVANQLLHEINDRVKQNLNTYLKIPHQVNQINAAAIRNGQLKLQNTQQLEKYFWTQLQIFDTLTFTGLGLENQDNLGAERFDNSSLTLRVSTQASNHIFSTYSTNKLGERQETLSSIPFDPRTRPWYKAAVAAGQPTWSDIYPNTAGITAYLGASMPFYNQQEQLLGVLLTNINLSQLGEFLQKLKVGNTGQVFIIERSGMLVATSTGEKPFRTQNQDYGAERVKATESRNLLTKETANYLAENLSKENIQSPKDFIFEINDKAQFVQVQPFQDQYGLDWLIVVVVPEADFMEKINVNTRMTILLCFLALILATGLGILTSRWILQPISKLKNAATMLSKGDFEQFEKTVDLKRSDELGILAKTFNSMAYQFQELLTSLEAKNRELQRLDQLKDEFLANTSHELRTPLNGIIGIAESLVDGVAGELSPKANTNLTMIVYSARRLSNLVNDILDFYKLSYQKLELTIKPISLREIVDIVVGLCQPLVGQKPLQLINAISPELPLVNADENRLQQILYNLIGNAIKFTESGLIGVSAAWEEKENSPNLLAITVSDTGIGIPEDKFERIFESFEQADGSTARNYGGTGLGLAVTKKLVELQGGSIRVVSKVGVGSQFTFTLPISEHQVKLQSESSPSSLNLPSLNLQEESLVLNEALIAESEKIKILIVDDEPINLQVLKNNLSLANYAVTQASNGLEALNLIASGFQPDLILLDVMMPRMTGYEVCQKLRDQFLPSELPIVMLTAKNQVSDIVEGFSSGANDYLSKPFSKQELLARIKTHLRLLKINAAYGRFVPHNFLKFLGHESIIDVKLGDHIQKEMTVLFSDIRSFTTLSEGMTPEENFKFINSYLSRVSPVIRKHNGFIDKYIGDAIMALFPTSADDAIQSAIEMQKQVIRYNQHRVSTGYSPISIGIGLHTGSLMLGTIGEQQRMESTVISDAVNLASRLEGLTKLYGSGILISGTTLNQLENPLKYNYRFLDRVQVKGKKVAVAVFEVYDGDSLQQQYLKTKTRTDFEYSVVLYHQNKIELARQGFKKILQIHPQDKVAMLYLQRCNQHQHSRVAMRCEETVVCFGKNGIPQATQVNQISGERNK